MEYRSVVDSDREAVANLIGEAFSPACEIEDAERGARVLVDGKGISAVVQALRFGQFFGGRAVPAAGVSNLAVAATARGKGCGGRIMREIVRELSEEGVAIACGYPASVSYHAALGFERSGLRTQYSATVKDTRLAYRGARVLGSEVVWEPCEQDGDAELTACYESVAPQHNGWIERPDWWWSDRVLTSYSGARSFRYFARCDGKVVAYAIFDHVPVRGPGELFDIECREVVWVAPAGRAALLQLFSDHGGMARRVSWLGAPDDTLGLGFSQHEVRVDWRLIWSARLVSVEQALQGRGYPADLTTTVDLDLSDPSDQLAPCRLRLDVEQGCPAVTRLRGPNPDIAHVDIGTLSAIYTGGLHPRQAARSGQLRATDRVIERLALLFYGPAPWMHEYF
jgi:predicted acetyltransferase